MSDIQLPNYLEFVGRTRENNGIKGYTIIDNIIPNEADTISISQVGTITAQLRKNKWYASQNIFVLRPYDKRYLSFAFLASINKALAGSFSDGYSNYPTLEKLKAQIINLPQTKNKEIDFAFIDDFLRELERARLRELERARLRELEAYLKATGLDNYELTEADKDALRNYKNLQWKEFNIKELFGASTRGRRLKSEDRIPGILPFVTAGEAETGISAFIGNNVTVFESNTTTIDMFGSAKYRNYKYGADDHVAVVHTEKLQKHAAIFVTSACHQAAHTGKFNYGNNFYAKDADELYIMLPTADGKQPDFNAMERLIAAMQKIVIADVAKYTARNLEATQEVIDNQEERQEPAITPLHIYDIYQPGRIPLYTLRAACGYFDEGEVPEPEGWIDVTGNGFTPDPKRHFAIHAKGDSMLPKIKDGDICIFEWYNAGTRNDEIVLTQSREYDPEYGGKYTIKRYHSEKVVSEEGWQHTKVELRPLNPDFDTVELTEDDDIRTIGIFKCVL